MSLDLTGIGSIADLAKGVFDHFWPPDMSPEIKAKMQLELETKLQEREDKLVGVQRDIIVAEMQQADSYTKRARPTIVYAGLGFIFLVNVAFPILAFFTGRPIPELNLPGDFWLAWGGVCSIWVIGRSAEKAGFTNTVVRSITGSKK